MAVTISEKDKADIADFNSFRKSAFGRLRIVNEGGMPVDVAYEELRAEAEMNALKAVMDERQFAKLGIARDYGIDPELFVSLKEVLPQFDENENGSINSDELEAAIDAMGGGLLPAVGRLTQAQQAALWQIYTTSTDPSKNPFGPGVGW